MKVEGTFHAINWNSWILKTETDIHCILMSVFFVQMVN